MLYNNLLTALKILEVPSAIPEDPLPARTPPKPSHSIKHSSAKSKITNDNSSPAHQSDLPSPSPPQVVISSAPAETTFLSSGSVPKNSLENHTTPMVRTGSASSARSVESSGSFTKPPPPPKPSTLTRKSTPVIRSSQEEGVSSPPSKTPRTNSGDFSTKPAPPPKPVKVKDEPVDQSPIKAPTKPARKSVKRGGVTEQRTQVLKDSDLIPSDNQTVTKDNGSSLSNHQGSPNHVKSASGPSQGSSKNTIPTHGSPKLDSKDQPAPPPKPSRNYKSIKILSPPPEKSAPPPAASRDQPSSNETVKPSELFRRSHSPMSESPSHTPSLSQGSGGSQDERPVPKPRTSSDSNPDKSHPPSKPPRKSIKLKSAN